VFREIEKSDLVFTLRRRDHEGRSTRKQEDLLYKVLKLYLFNPFNPQQIMKINQLMDVCVEKSKRV
jgi:hypothetical protein